MNIRGLLFTVAALLGTLFSNAWADENSATSVDSCVRSDQHFDISPDSSYQGYAEFLIELLPDGKQAAEPRLLKPSDVPGYDEAAKQAIKRSNPFPRRKDGTVPRCLKLRMYPQPVSNTWVDENYVASVVSCVRSRLDFAVPEGVPTSVYAEFEVELFPSGEQATDPRLVKRSGLPGYDEAARRAILRCDPFPRRRDGTVPRSLRLQMYPQVVPLGGTAPKPPGSERP